MRATRMPMEPRSRALLASLCGAALVSAGLADLRWRWLAAAAETVRGGAGLSVITVRALWLLRVWLWLVGAGLLWTTAARRLGGGGPHAVADVRAHPGVVALPAALAFGMVGWTLSLGLLGDDFLWLSAWAERGLAVLRPEAGSPHYIPLGLVLCNVPHMVCGPHALVYRMTVVLLHGGVGVAVARVGSASGLPPGSAAGAGAIFVTTALAYEPVMWATGLFYLIPALLVGGVLTVLCDDGAALSSRRAWIVAGAAAVAGFCIEQAAGLTLFVALWAVSGPGRPHRRAVRIPLIVGPAAGALLLVALRAGARSATEALQPLDVLLASLNQVLGGLLVANSPAGLMLGGWLGRHAVLRWCGLIGGILALASLWRALEARGRTLLLAWLCLWLPAWLFSPQSSRYWYLPAIPASVGIMHAITRVGEGVAGPSLRAARWAAAGLVSVWVALGAVAMGLRVPDWRAADRIARAVERDAAARIAAEPSLRRLVLADVPDGVGTDLWPAYVFNNGLREALRLAPVDAAWDGEVQLVNGPHRPWATAIARDARRELPLDRLAEAAGEAGTAVLVYAPDKPGLAVWPATGVTQ